MQEEGADTSGKRSSMMFDIMNFKGTFLMKVLVFVFIFVPLLLFIVTMPISLFFTLFSLTREYLPGHSDFDTTKTGLLLDAVFCGLFFLPYAVLLSNVCLLFVPESPSEAFCMAAFLGIQASWAYSRR